jgi:hypothetical protein
LSVKGIGRYLLALIASWWVIAFIVGVIGVITVGHPAAAAEVWVFGLAVLAAFFVQSRLPFWQE